MAAQAERSHAFIQRWNIATKTKFFSGKSIEKWKPSFTQDAF